MDEATTTVERTETITETAPALPAVTTQEDNEWLPRLRTFLDNPASLLNPQMEAFQAGVKAQADAMTAAMGEIRACLAPITAAIEAMRSELQRLTPPPPPPLPPTTETVVVAPVVAPETATAPPTENPAPAAPASRKTRRLI